MVGFIYRCSAFDATVSVYSHTQDTAPTRALLFCFLFLIRFFTAPDYVVIARLCKRTGALEVKRREATVRHHAKLARRLRRHKIKYGGLLFCRHPEAHHPSPITHHPSPITHHFFLAFSYTPRNSSHKIPPATFCPADTFHRNNRRYK